MLRRTSAGGTLRSLDSDGPARTRLGRPLFCPLGVSGGIYRPLAAGDSYIHRTAGGSCAHAARTVSYLYISGIVAVVPGAGLSRNEVGRELARTGEIFPQIRCGDYGGAGGWCGLVCVGSLAEPGEENGAKRGGEKAS